MGIKYFVLSAAGNDNEIAIDANANKIVFTTKDTKLYVLVVTLSARNNKKISKLLSKDQFIGKNIKQKVRIKIQ